MRRGRRRRLCRTTTVTPPCTAGSTPSCVPAVRRTRTAGASEARLKNREEVMLRKRRRDGGSEVTSSPPAGPLAGKRPAWRAHITKGTVL